MIKELRITKNDLQSFYCFKFQDSLGANIDLTGATVYCTMRSSGGGTAKINRQTAGIVITTAAAGEGEYRWQPGETDTVDSYLIEFEVNPLSGGKFTLPKKSNPAVVIIEDSLDAS